MDMEILETTIDQPVAESVESVFERLYENAFPPFARFAAKRNGSLEDARDVFHDALVIYYEQSRPRGVRIQVSAEAYVVGIAKHLWIRKFHSGKNTIPLNDAESLIMIPVDYYPTINEMRLLKFLESSGKRCLELLRRFYYESSSLTEIAAALGYSNEHSAAAQKFKCISKMREAIRSKAINYEDFLH